MQPSLDRNMLEKSLKQGNKKDKKWKHDWKRKMGFTFEKGELTHFHVRNVQTASKAKWMRRHQS